MKVFSFVFMVMVTSSVAFNYSYLVPCETDDQRIEKITIFESLQDKHTKDRYLITTNGHERDNLKTSFYSAHVTCSTSDVATWHFYFEIPTGKILLLYAHSKLFVTNLQDK